MAADFVSAEPAARQVFEEADEAFGAPLSRLISEGPESELQQTEITQPALLTASIAIYRTLEPRLPAAPSFFAGHSLGEYSALVAAGGLPLGEAVKLVRHRGALMQGCGAERRGRDGCGDRALERRGGADLRRGPGCGRSDKLQLSRPDGDRRSARPGPSRGSQAEGRRCASGRHAGGLRPLSLPAHGARHGEAGSRPGGWPASSIRGFP